LAGKAPPASALAPRQNASSSSEARIMSSRPGREEISGAGAERSADGGPGSLKRPCPGGLPGSHGHAPRVCFRRKEGEGAEHLAAADRREEGLAAAPRRGGDCASSRRAVDGNFRREPAFLETSGGERDQRNDSAAATASAATGERPTFTDEAGKQLAEDGSNDGFAAPSFLTPPVIAISDGGAPAHRGLGGGDGSGGGGGSGGNGVMMGHRAARSTPLSATSSCYSGSSTPTNDSSSSPALAVASPSAKASWKP
ncbi:unnamed protein product, partial [Laminaria digitata]